MTEIAAFHELTGRQALGVEPWPDLTTGGSAELVGRCKDHPECDAILMGTDEIGVVFPECVAEGKCDGDKVVYGLLEDIPEAVAELVRLDIQRVWGIEPSLKVKVLDYAELADGLVATVVYEGTHTKNRGGIQRQVRHATQYGSSPIRTDNEGPSVTVEVETVK